VRNYAQLLKLDPQPLVERMAPLVEKAPELGPMISARHRERLPSPTPGRRSTLLYVGFSLVLLALVGAMAYEWQREKAAPQSVVAVEPQRPEPAPAPIEEKPVEKPIAQPVEKSEPKPQAAAEPAAESVAEPAAPPPDTHRLVLRMAEEAWLEVRDGAGRDLVSSLNPAGSERVVRGQPPFQLVIGNAAHVELTYDGKRVDLQKYMRGEVARFTLK
jgi:cytoskeleton protein RodZ